MTTDTAEIEHCHNSIHAGPQPSNYRRPTQGGPLMTPLQILSSTLTDGATLTLSKRADGYHIEVIATDDAGQPVRREVVHPRLEQALFLVMERAEVDGEAVKTG